MNRPYLKSFFYDSLDSTMDEARRLVTSGKIKEIGYISANEQIKGRGTRGRAWDSPQNAGIYLSVVHLPKQKKYFPITNLYTPACGIACIEALKEICNIDCFLKPVNDIYIQNKKLGGILVESKLHKAGISMLITGIRINTKKTNHTLDRKIIEPISLEEILGEKEFKNFSNKKLIECIVNRICFWYSKISLLLS